MSTMHVLDPMKLYLRRERKKEEISLSRDERELYVLRVVSLCCATLGSRLLKEFETISKRISIKSCPQLISMT